jgi:DNA replication protein DnaC
MSRSTGAQSIADSLKALLGHAEFTRLIEAGKQAKPEMIDLTCPRCKGAGWLRYDVSPGVPEFGQLKECRCGIVAARRAELHLGASKIPAEYANLDLRTFPDQRIADDLRRWWREGLNNPWLLMVGELGVGKTGLTIGLVKIALAEGQPAVFRVVPELLTDIRGTYDLRAESRESGMMTALKGVTLLALDDFGTERMTDWVQERLFEILNHRYNERRPTIITTNMDPDEIRDHVGDRIFSRIMGMGWRYEIVGRNLRIGPNRRAS